MPVPTVAPSQDALAALAGENGWRIEQESPDMWGDVRVYANLDGELLTLVFDDTGKLTGGYRDAVDGKQFHTTRRTDVRHWIQGE